MTAIASQINETEIMQSKEEGKLSTFQIPNHIHLSLYLTIQITLE